MIIYEVLKKAAKYVFGDLLIKYQANFRKIIYPLYIGNKYICNICNARLSHFITLSNGELLCPRCGSLPRTRRLYQIVENYDLQNKSILHLSPSNAIRRKLKNRFGNKYITSDFAGEFEADKSLDIRKTNEKDNHYHLIICYHILEHIMEDNEAILELYRILSPGGSMLIQTPFKEGDIYENHDIISPGERTKHFGQHDHVRVYSPKGLKERLEKCNFQVEIMQFHEENSVLGLKNSEIVLHAMK